MDSATLKALRLSIRHWQRNLKKVKLGKLKIGDVHGSRCALCKLFKNFCLDNDNNMCPVKIRSKAIFCGCMRTPWMSVKSSFLNSHSKGKLKLLKNVKDEVKFLQSLLPVRRKRCKR